MKKVVIIILSLLAAAALYAGTLVFYQMRVVMGPSSGQKIDAAARTKSALLVIDIQNAYTNTPSTRDAAAPSISRINSVIEKARKNNSDIIYIAAVRKKGLLPAFFSPAIAAEGSADARFDPRLSVVNSTVFYKYKADAFYSKEFESYLASRNIGRLVITGVAAEFCVGETVKAAAQRGFDLTVVSDAVIPAFGETSLKKKLSQYSSLGAKLVTSSQF